METNRYRDNFDTETHTEPWECAGGRELHLFQLQLLRSSVRCVEPLLVVSSQGGV